MDPTSAYGSHVFASPSSVHGWHVASHVSTIFAPLTVIEPLTPTAAINLTCLSSLTALENANSSQETLILTKTTPTEFTSTTNVACSSSPIARVSASTIDILPNLVTLSVSSIGLLANEVVQENVFVSNLLVALDSGDYSVYEMNVASHKTRGGRFDQIYVKGSRDVVDNSKKTK